MAAIAVFLLAASVLAFNPPPALVRHLDATDVTAHYAKSSFRQLLTSLPSGAAARAEGEGWTFSAPDDSASFFWNPEAAAGSQAARIVTPAAPFLEAGLNPSLLPGGMLQDDMLVFGLKADSGTGGALVVGNPAQAFDSLLAAYRDRFGYHFQLEHFGLELDGGNMLEWAGDPVKNALDLVFVLDPAVLEQAGVDANRIEGWILGTVIVHTDSGRKVEVSKLLKPFDLQ